MYSNSVHFCGIISLSISIHRSSAYSTTKGERSVKGSYIRYLCVHVLYKHYHPYPFVHTGIPLSPALQKLSNFANDKRNNERVTIRTCDSAASPCAKVLWQYTLPWIPKPLLHVNWLLVRCAFMCLDILYVWDTQCGVISARNVFKLPFHNVIPLFTAERFGRRERCLNIISNSRSPFACVSRIRRTPRFAFKSSSNSRRSTSST